MTHPMAQTPAYSCTILIASSANRTECADGITSGADCAYIAFSSCQQKMSPLQRLPDVGQSQMDVLLRGHHKEGRELSKGPPLLPWHLILHHLMGADHQWMVQPGWDMSKRWCDPDISTDQGVLLLRHQLCSAPS